MSSRTLIPCALAALLLAGCAWGPRVEVTPVVLPTSALTYRLIGAEPATAVSLAVEGALRRQMEAQGWREVEDAPVWRVEAAYSIRPQKVGGYSDETARDEEWVAEPRLPQWWARKRLEHRLTLVLNGPVDSPTVYQTSATITDRDRTPEAAIDRLVEAVTTELKPGA